MLTQHPTLKRSTTEGTYPHNKGLKALLFATEGIVI